MGYTLGFYDMKSRKKFSTSVYKTVIKKGRKYAVAISPDGNEAWRFLGKV